MEVEDLQDPCFQSMDDKKERGAELVGPENTFSSLADKVTQVVPARPDEMSVVDPRWEYIDPNPNITALFLQFNKLFFMGALKKVDVSWSRRLKTSAGVCDCLSGVNYRLCSIRLNERLLKSGPRRNLVEALLHEMIHAYLYVTDQNDEDPHGANFIQQMLRINSITGANIPIVHNFLDQAPEHGKVKTIQAPETNLQTRKRKAPESKPKAKKVKTSA